MTARASIRRRSAGWASSAWRSGCGGWADGSPSNRSRGGELRSRRSYPSRRRTERTGSTGMSIRILLADDHTIVRDGLRALVEKQPDMAIVAEAEDGRDSVRLADEHTPDVVIMDIAM